MEQASPKKKYYLLLLVIDVLCNTFNVVSYWRMSSSGMGRHVILVKYRHFGGTYHLHFQGENNELKTRYQQLATVARCKELITIWERKQPNGIYFIADVKELFYNGVSVVVFFLYHGYIMTGRCFVTDVIEIYLDGRLWRWKSTMCRASVGGGTLDDLITKGSGICTGTVQIGGRAFTSQKF
jgi:hypothetical protein